MFRCKCGSEEFYAHTSETMAIKYDGNGDEVDGGEIMDVERPAWNKAYHCIKCDKAYSDLPPKEPKMEWLREKERKYLANGYSGCPICGSGDVVGDSLQSDGNVVWQHVGCAGCSAQWDDIYHMREVEIKNWPEDRMPKETINPNKAFKK